MRRTRDPMGLDDVPGVSSRGPTLPFLFGRAALIAGGDPSSGYSARHHGLTVRATAMVDTEDRGRGRARIKAAGPPVVLTGPGAQTLLGRTPWTLGLTYWLSLVENLPREVSLSVDGEILDSGLVVGRFSPTADSLGAEVVPGPRAAFLDLGYVPLHEVVGGLDRVIGFGLATLVALDPTDPATDYVLTRLPPIVAPENASAVADARVARRLGLLGAQDPTAFDRLLKLHREFEGAVLAPIQVR